MDASNSGLPSEVLLALLASTDAYLLRNLFLTKVRPGKCPMDLATKRLVIILIREITGK